MRHIPVGTPSVAPLCKLLLQFVSILLASLAPYGVAHSGAQRLTPFVSLILTQ